MANVRATSCFRWRSRHATHLDVELAAPAPVDFRREQTYQLRDRFQSARDERPARPNTDRVAEARLVPLGDVAALSHNHLAKTNRRGPQPGDNTGARPPA